MDIFKFNRNILLQISRSKSNVNFFGIAQRTFAVVQDGMLLQIIVLLSHYLRSVS